MDDKRRRLRRRLAVLAALAAAALFAIPALGEPPTGLTIVPDGTTGGSGFTDVRSMTYASAKDNLAKLSTITLPVAIPGLERLDVSNVTLDSDDAGRSLSLSGSATLPLRDGEQKVDLLVTAIWADDAATQPMLAIAAKADDLSLSKLNPLWNASYGDVRFATARLAVSSADQTIDPAALPEKARGFYPEPVELTGGVSFAGDLKLEGRLADAFGYAGYSGDVALEGSLSASAAALFGKAGDAQLGDLDLKATLGKSPNAPQWIAERSSTYEFKLAGGHPGISVDEAVTLALDGTTNRFKGHVDIAPGGEIKGEIALVGALDAPYGIDASKLSDITLRMSRGAGGLAFDVAVDGSPLHVDAALEGASAEFSVAGPVTAPKLVTLGGSLLGTNVAGLPGTEDIKFDGAKFSLARGTFSLRAQTTFKGLDADALLTVRKAPGAPAKPLFALRLDDVLMSSLLPGAPDTLGNLRLPALDLTATTLPELSAANLTAPERDFFGAVYATLPDTLRFTPGINVAGKLPLDALGVRETFGFTAGSEVALTGTLGANVTLGKLQSGISLNNLKLSATLPAGKEATNLPQWVVPSGPTTLTFSAASGAVAASFATAADVTVNGSKFPTTLNAALSRNGQRTSLHFTGTLAGWRKPFGLTWVDSIDGRLVLDTTFGGSEPAKLSAAIEADTTLAGKRAKLRFGLAKEDKTTATLTASLLDTVPLGDAAGLFGDRLTNVAPSLTSELKQLTLTSASASLSVGAGTTGLELTATTSYKNLQSDLLVAVRSGGFTVGIRPTKPIKLSQLAPGAPELTLPAAALVLGTDTSPRRADQLSPGEFDFYKALYGCDTASCAAFTGLQATSGLRLLAGFDLGSDLTKAAGAIGIKTSGRALLEGTIGTDFSLSAKLGSFDFANTPDWYDGGNVGIEISTTGMKFTGSLGLKVHREGDRWKTRCDGGDMLPGGCYDRLKLKIDAGLSLTSPGLTLTASLRADQSWDHAFGVDWLSIRRVALQLGVKATGDVTMGFQGDVRIGDKDIAAALKVGLAPAPGVGIRPNLIGFSAASKAGFGVSDLVTLNELMTGVKLDTAALPNVSLRNVFLQFSQEDDTDLCLTRGLRFNAELYLGDPGSAANRDDDQRDANGCRRLDVDPKTATTCEENKAQGCLAAVYGRLDTSGLVAGAHLNGFELGPLTFDDSSLALALTPTSQYLRVKGGMTLGTFAEGRANLSIDKDGFDLTADAKLLNGATEVYIEAGAALDVANPSFNVETWLRADTRAAIGNLVAPKAEQLRPAVDGLRAALALISGGGSVGSFDNLKTKLNGAHANVPPEVDTMLTTLADARRTLEKFPGQQLTLNRLLAGFSFGVDGVPGERILGVCTGVVDSAGRCWFIAPGTVSVGGICPALSVPSSSCSWPGLMSRYVRPALRAAFKTATGMEITDAGLTTVIDRFANAASSIVNLDCAHFKAGADALGAGVQLETRLTFFGAPLQLSAAWNFNDPDADALFKELLRGLFSSSGQRCPDIPAGHEQVAPEVKGRSLTAGLSAGSINEGGEFTVRATFDEVATGYPAVRVIWGDGTPPATIPSGEARTVMATHRYVKPGRWPITLAVQDDGGFTKQITGFVRNVVPALGDVSIDPIPSNEGATVTLRGAFTNAGADDYHTVTVGWGDGSPDEVVRLAASARTFAVPHRYTDDRMAPVSVVVADDDGDSVSRNLVAPVLNVAPSAVKLKPLKVINGSVTDVTESADVTYGIEFTDPGPLDTHTVTVDWGDARVSTIKLGAGTTSVELPHRYEDDGSFPVKVSITDDDGARGDTIVSIGVRDVAPRVTAKLDSGSIAQGRRARIMGTIDDPGRLDRHTVTIDWGEGLSDADRYQTIALKPGQRTFDADRAYGAAGSFTITAEATDDDGLKGSVSLPLTVTG